MAEEAAGCCSSGAECRPSKPEACACDSPAAVAEHGASSCDLAQNCRQPEQGADVGEWAMTGSLAFEGAFDWQSCPDV